MASDVAPTQQRSARAVLDDWARALQLTAEIEANPHRLLGDIIANFANISGEAPALLSDKTSLSYASLIALGNRYSRWALDQCVAKGDVVCLMMKNCPDYVAIWMGITQIGGVVALINDQLTGAALAHCIDVVGARGIIVSEELLHVVTGLQHGKRAALHVWQHGGSSGPVIMIDAYPSERLTIAERPRVKLSDRALCIYTSGTTGMPKAANVSHRRILTWSYWFAGMSNIRSSDRMYNCLPMHHSVGGVVAIGSMLVSGASVVIREKFSARNFWDDVVRWECTLFQYIGELCRYLVNAPSSAAETTHRLRLCAGNGLRADVWQQFQQRFEIPQILEFYAASEGSFSLFNLEGKPGAIGRVPGFLNHRFPADIIRIDIETETPLRSADGLCLRCATNETGEAIGKLSETSDAITGRFEGYSSDTESQKKILRDVFVTGDAWLRTGDLMRKDEKNFFYFVDRMGDTFRWKGENVSTTQVSEALCACTGVIEAAVYGVVIPGAEGRAGMATLVVDESFDLTGLWTDMRSRLPAYACPVFLRLREGMTITSTYKQQKHGLQRQGYNPVGVTDPLYIQDQQRKGYRIFGQTDFDLMQTGHEVL